MRRMQTHSGKGFFVVDLVDGNVLWSYTRADNSDLDDPMPAPPAIVDTDNDGFIDTAYIGDIGGNMWRFKFCKSADGDSCTTSNWTGGRLFEATAASGIRPIYTLAAVAKDGEGNFWVYWGTGDKTDPTAANAQEKIFALKDTDFTSTRTGDDLQNISSEGSVYTDSSKYGYYINLSGQGEKMLSDVTVFGGVLYVATFTPEQSNNPCVQGGTAKLYGLRRHVGRRGACDPGRHRPAPQHDHRNGDLLRPGHFAEARQCRNAGPVRHDQRRRSHRRPDPAGEHQSARSGESDQHALLERQARGVAATSP